MVTAVFASHVLSQFGVCVEGGADVKYFMYVVRINNK